MVKIVSVSFLLAALSILLQLSLVGMAIPMKKETPGLSLLLDHQVSTTMPRRAYHLLRQGGIQKQHIVLFMDDDVAFDDMNFNPGVIQYNRSSPDVYGGIMKDYTGQNLTLHNFLAVLTGNRSLLKGGSGRVLETKPSDRVFLYYAGHGRLDAIRA
ncbi:hypothetical protein R6Q57_010124 [Mikania cordata]